MQSIKNCLRAKGPLEENLNIFFSRFSGDEISWLEGIIEQARWRAERNAGRAVRGCGCRHCQDIRRFHPHLSELPLEPRRPWWFGFPSWMENRR